MKHTIDTPFLERQRYQELCQFLPDGLLLTDLDGSILEANQSASEILNVPVEKLLGSHIAAFIASRERGAFRRHFQLLLEGKRLHGWEVGIQPHQKKRFFAELTAALTRDNRDQPAGIRWFLRDITDRKEAHDALQAEIAERKQAAIQIRLQLTALEAAADGIVITDRRGVILWGNPAFMNMTGYSSKELIGNTFQIMSSGVHDAQFYEDLWRTILSGQVWFGEIINRRKDGSLYVEEQTIAPLVNEGHQISHFIAIKHDITGRKAAEKALRASEETYRQLCEQLEVHLQKEKAMRIQLIQAENFSAIGRMVATVAHELNNPLQTIKNCLYLMQGELSPASQLEGYLEMATSEIQRISNLVMQLREIYRPKGSANMGIIPVGKLIEDIHTLLTPHLQRQNIVWSLEPAPLLDIQPVKCIADQLKQVFLNICFNAIEAMQPEGGELAISFIGNDQIPGNLANHVRPMVGLRFRDTGPGISPEALPKLFDPFFTTKEAGTGLGLAISYEIVQRHGGQIWIDSLPGQGATFTVWLPIFQA